MADEQMDFVRSMSIATSGLRAQAGRMRVISENIANADSTAQTAGGDPYRRKVPTFSSELDRTLDARVVSLGRIRPDTTAFRVKHEPGNPAADASGNVKYPNVNPLIEMTDMAVPADCGIVIHGFLAAGNAVRIVTSLARQFAFAPGKTFGLTQPVYGTHRLEFVVVTGAGRVIEEECEVLDRLAGHVGKRAPGESFDLGGNASAGSLEVALQADFRTELGIQAGGIYDAAAYRFHFGAAAPGGSHMVAAGSVTPLAVDAFGQVAGENRFAAGRFVPCRNSRNPVMAKDTLVRYEAASPRMIGIGTRRHGPGSAGFVRIPA